MNNRTAHPFRPVAPGAITRQVPRERSTTSRVALLWTVLWTAEIIGAGVSPALAQRRRAEPEANPNFQSEVQGSTSGQEGQPVSAPPAPAPAAPASREPVPRGGQAVALPAFPPASGQEPAMSEVPGGESTQPQMSSIQIGSKPEAEETPSAPKTPMETRVTVRVKDAPLATFLDTISAQSKVNFIIEQGLKDKRITAFLQNVTVREALQTLLELKGLTYRRVGKSNTYIITTRSHAAPNRITRIYTLSYISLIPILASNAPASGSQLPVLLSGGSSQSGAGGIPGMGSAGGQGGADKEGGISIIAIIKSLLTKDGTIAIDARSNSLIVTDIPDVFPQVEQVLAELDKKIPQVMIEAQIVEINSDKTQDLGIEWGGPNGQLASFTGGARSTVFPFNLNGSGGGFHFFSPNNQVSQVLSPPSLSGGSGASGAGSTALFGNIIQSSIVNLSQLTVLLKALVSRSEARFLGKPKVLTLNNKTARIEITQDQAIGAASVQASAGAAGATGVATQTVERQTTGLILEATPQVNKEGYITMLIQPKFISVQASAIITNGQPVFDPVTRTASTMVRVKNGQTMVLGGLLSSRESKVVRKVPILGYIPIVGWLFTSVSTERANTDLVIFLTPTVVRD